MLRKIKIDAVIKNFILRMEYLIVALGLMSIALDALLYYILRGIY